MIEIDRGGKQTDRQIIDTEVDRQTEIDNDTYIQTEIDTETNRQRERNVKRKRPWKKRDAKERAEEKTRPPSNRKRRRSGAKNAGKISRDGCESPRLAPPVNVNDPHQVGGGD